MPEDGICSTAVEDEEIGSCQVLKQLHNKDFS
jgi:hypothetical protein